MAEQLDEIDVRLLRELELDADRPNVELARLVGLSPAATLNRVRRLKDSGVIASIQARTDPARAGFPLQVFLAATLSGHDQAANRRFEATVRKLGNVIQADWVTGETDVLLHVVARDVEELQKVLLTLSGRGGAQRLLTLLRLEPLKPHSPLPVTGPSIAVT
jgi:Lrp/AsnC family leucine-responsive transcriptional regulator